MQFSRRNFLKTGGLALASLPFLSTFLGQRHTLAEAAGPTLAKEGVEPAKSLKYCANADKPNKFCEARKAKDKKDQYCFNCQLYTGDRKAEKKAQGKCMIMPSNLVEGGGWCQSWVKTPG